MAVVPAPTKIRKLVRSRVDIVSDHGVFTVQRLGYEGLPRDMFVFTCPDWCNVVAETPEGDVVFVWQYRPGTDAMSLEVPGGVIDEGEAPEAAAARELREETGYEAERFELLSVVEPNPALQNNRCYTFLARGARKTAETDFDDVEDLELALVPARDVPAVLDSGEVTHALVVCALETYLRRTR